jgi:hypothetical protein
MMSLKAKDASLETPACIAARANSEQEQNIECFATELFISAKTVSADFSSPSATKWTCCCSIAKGVCWQLAARFCKWLNTARLAPFEAHSH